MRLKHLKAMSDDRISIMIGKLCGWAMYSPRQGMWAKRLETRKAYLYKGRPVMTHSELPEYATDLRCIHSAENELIINPARDVHYQWALGVVMAHDWRLWRATARQRAEALIIVMDEIAQNAGKYGGLK